jgi:L-ascorbate metabolism protein UlaG (beta-lactamase superfamily)
MTPPPASSIHRLQRLRHRNDPSVQRESNWSEADNSLPSGLSIQWLGTAGFALGYENTTVLIDPYVSRKDLATTLRASSLTSDTELVGQVIDRADAVLIGHTHFDHAVDVATIARQHGCTVYGSTSLQHLMGLHSMGERAVVVEPHRRYEIGPFTVSFTPSEHSKLLLGLKVPSDGELTCDSLDRLGSARYRCGQVFGITIEVAGQVLYHQGSANLIDDEIRTHDVDVFLCGIAGRMYTHDFIDRAVRALRPRIVLAHHHDNFFRPLGDPMGFSFNVNLGGFVEDLANTDPDIAVHTLEPLQVVAGH